MLPKIANEAVKSNFDLKNHSANLINLQARSERASVSLANLEAMRVSSNSIPASKHGLETICGSSCETGAM